jgi:hypothetical protein
MRVPLTFEGLPERPVPGINIASGALSGENREGGANPPRARRCNGDIKAGATGIYLGKAL